MTHFEGFSAMKCRWAVNYEIWNRVTFINRKDLHQSVLYQEYNYMLVIRSGKFSVSVPLYSVFSPVNLWVGAVRWLNRQAFVLKR